MLKYQHVKFCHTLNLSCLSRRWPGMRRTTIRTHPNRSGGKLESTDDATQNNSTHLWSRWVSPGQWTCRGDPVFGPERGSLRRVWGWRYFKHPGWTLMYKENKACLFPKSSVPLFRLKLKFPLLPTAFGCSILSIQMWHHRLQVSLTLWGHLDSCWRFCSLMTLFMSPQTRQKVQRKWRDK